MKNLAEMSSDEVKEQARSDARGGPGGWYCPISHPFSTYVMEIYEEEFSQVRASLKKEIEEEHAFVGACTAWGFLKDILAKIRGE